MTSINLYQSIIELIQDRAIKADGLNTLRSLNDTDTVHVEFEINKNAAYINFHSNSELEPILDIQLKHDTLSETIIEIGMQKIKFNKSLEISNVINTDINVENEASIGYLYVTNTSLFNKESTFMKSITVSDVATFNTGIKTDIIESVTDSININSNNIIIGTNITLSAGTTNSLNLGNVLYGINTYSTTSGFPSATPQSTGKIGIGVVTPTANLHIAASTTASALMRLEVGPAPTSPNDGDIWLQDLTLTGLKIHLSGVTRTITIS